MKKMNLNIKTTRKGPKIEENRKKKCSEILKNYNATNKRKKIKKKYFFKCKS